MYGREMRYVFFLLNFGDSSPGYSKIIDLESKVKEQSLGHRGERTFEFCWIRTRGNKWKVEKPAAKRREKQFFYGKSVLFYIHLSEGKKAD